MVKATKRTVAIPVKFELLKVAGVTILVASFLGHSVYANVMVDDPSILASYLFGALVVMFWLPVALTTLILYGIGVVYRNRDVRVVSATNILLFGLSIGVLAFLICAILREVIAK